MTHSITQTLTVPVQGHYSVLVAGAGVAGVAAAIAAARQGAKVLLLEKSTVPGGLATLGLIAIYLPLCDGKGRKLIGGIAEELLRESIRYGYGNLPACWQDGSKTIQGGHERYQTVFNTSAFVLAMDALLERAGVEVLYDTVVADVVRTGNRVDAVVVENKDGRTAYTVDAVVDATGDADVFAQAHAACTMGENFLSVWAMAMTEESIARAHEARDVGKAVVIVTAGSDNAGHGQPVGKPSYDRLSAVTVNDDILAGRTLLREKLEANDPKQFAYVELAGMPQLRTTRCIEGVKRFCYASEGVCQEDSIGCAGDWRKAGPSFEVPFAAMYNDTLENVIAAGRTVCCDAEGWEVARVIPVAALTGHAAGRAAAMLGKSAVQTLDVQALQQSLAQDGVMIHLTAE